MIGSDSNRCLHVAAMAAGLVGLLAGGPLAAESPPPLKTVSRFLGPAGQALDVTAFAAAVSRAGMPAQGVAGKEFTWQKSPADGGAWLAVVTAGFGEQANAYAFSFAANGAVERFAHVSYGKNWKGEWLVPVEKLAVLIADEAGARVPAARPPIRIQVGRVEAAAAAAPVADLDAFEAIAWGAACEAGWMPTAASADAEASLAVESGVGSFTLRLGVASGGRRRELVKKGVPIDEVHDALRRLFAAVAPGSPVADTFRLGPAAAILATPPDRLVFTVDRELRAFDTRTGRRTWRGDPKAAVPGAGSFVAWQGADGATRLVRWQPSLAFVEPADGRIAPLAPIAAGADWSFDLADGGKRAVIASGTVVATFVDGKEAWRHSEPEPVTCGPAIVGGLVIAGTDAGELFALPVAGGAVAWRQPLGRPTAAGEIVVVFARGSDTLHAVTAATGRPAWSLPVGDVLVRSPIATDAGIVVATKSNRVLLLDAKSGKPRAERRLPSWIGDVVPLPGASAAAGQIACLTRDGTVTLLGGGDLEPIATGRLNVRPGFGRPANLVFARQFPLAVPDAHPTSDQSTEGQLDELADDLAVDVGEKGDCLLAADEQGYAWIIPLKRLVEDRR
jgi:outer membrane protein assembly factor BamB